MASRPRLRFARLTPLSALVALLVASPGCIPKEENLAGDRVGQFRVVGQLESTECAGGHPAPEEFIFYVELREEVGSTRGYWKVADGPLVSGTIGDEGFRFEYNSQHPAIPADPEHGIAGCTLFRAETVTAWVAPNDVTADAGVDGAPAMLGETQIQIGVMTGSECSGLLIPNGGAFVSLPCEIRYQLSGESVEF